MRYHKFLNCFFVLLFVHAIMREISHEIPALLVNGETGRKPHIYLALKQVLNHFTNSLSVI